MIGNSKMEKRTFGENRNQFFSFDRNLAKKQLILVSEIQKTGSQRAKEFGFLKK